MTWFARLLLVLTSLAPICFVQAAVEAGRAIAAARAKEACDEQVRVAIMLVAAVVLLVLVCLLLLKGVERSNAPVPKNLSEPATKDGEPLAFLASYALPLVAAKDGGLATTCALAAFALVMVAALWQLQVFHVNPLLAVLGYRFFAAKSDGMPVLVLTRRTVLPGGRVSVIRVSEYLWLLCDSATRGGADGSAAGASP
jgi:hypothetical protein